MGHVDRVDKNVALCGIRLRRCKSRYHRHIFLWLISAAAFNNVMILFMLLFPLAAELKLKYENNGFGFKHYFQLELATSLMSRGLRMCNEERREKAGTTLCAFYHNICKVKWSSRQSQVATTTHRRGRGRPAKQRGRGRGRPSKQSSSVRRGKKHNKKPFSKKPFSKKQLELMRERLKNWEFQSPPPFVPRKVGRKRKAAEGMSVFVDSVKHTLVHASTLGIWAQKQGRCVCCYARAPPLPPNSSLRYKKIYVQRCVNN